MHHFTWVHLIPFVDHDLYHTMYKFLSVIIFLGLGLIARIAIRDSQTAFVPSNKFSVKGFIELFVEQVAALSDSIIGEGGRPMIPLFCFFFLFIFIQNVLGLIPGFLPPTQNINTTIALGTFSFIAYNVYGLKEHGLAYFKQFVGPVLFLAPLFLCIETLSHVFRMVSLGFRLYGNMTGDHTVISIFLELTPFLVPVIFYFLGLFVCTLQAFVFTILSMVYVSLAISHDH